MSDILSIKIITFNRGDKLRHTLDCLSKSPFRNFPIEVLDNASIDHTASVCLEASTKFGNFSVFRHEKNLGLCINMLRAYERFSSTYCWLLGDDDDYDFSSAEELIGILRSEKYNAVIVSEILPITGTAGFSGHAAELQKRGARLYQTFSFLPSIIFKRSIWTAQVTFRCNKAASSLWPHAPFTAAIIEGLEEIHVLQSVVVVRQAPTDYTHVKPLGFYDIAHSAWYLEAGCRKRFFDDMLEIRSLSFGSLLRRWATEKCTNRIQLWQVLFFFNLYRYSKFHYNLGAIGILLTPRWLLMIAQKKLGRGGYVPQTAETLNTRL